MTHLYELDMRFSLPGIEAPRTDWDTRFLELARHVATWSKDPSTRVGAVIADDDHRIVSVGFNGLPRGVEDREDRLNDRDIKLRLTLHAEHNAVLFAGRPVTGCTCYTWPLPPCAHCSAVLVQVGIRRIVSARPSREVLVRWGTDLRLAEGMLKEAGVALVVL